MQYKIKRIIINDENSNIIRNIDICDFFFVMGQNMKNDKTSNALGKTLLVNLISFCLCGNNNKDIEKLNGYSIKLELVDKTNKKYIVERTVGNTEVIINSKAYKLEDAKEILLIDRNKLEHTIHKGERTEVILDNMNKYYLQNAAMDLLGFTNLRIVSNQITELYDQQKKIKDQISTYKNNISQTNFTTIKIEIDELNEKLLKVQSFDKDELLSEINELVKNNQKLHSERNNLLEKKYFYNERIKTISAYLQNIEENPINVLNFIKQAKAELANVIEVKMEDAIKYHEIMSAERVSLLNKEKQKIESRIELINQRINSIGEKIKPIQDRLNEKDEIQKYINCQNDLVNKLKELSVDQAFAIEIEQSAKVLDDINQDKLSKLIELKNINISKEKEKFTKYISELLKKLYGNISYTFDIVIADSDKISKIKYPVNFVFHIPNDDSEGIRNVRNFVFDLLMLKYSEEIESMIWDSSVFNGIDPKQLNILINEIKKVTSEMNKQAIVCMSAFQLNDYYSDFMNNLDNENLLLLSEKDLLLKKKI